MNELWGLIGVSTNTIERYLAFLECDFAKSQEGVAVAELIGGMIATELDRLDALRAAYRKFGKITSKSYVQNEFEAIADKYDEARRIIK